MRWPSTIGARIANAAKVETPMAGMSSASAMPCAKDTPRRTPVNAPGPRPTATAASSLRAMPASASRASAHGRASSAWRRGAISKRSISRSSAATATLQASVEVSSAISFIRKA